jgi:hypothetical protein
MPKIKQIEEELKARSVHLPVSFWGKLEQIQERNHSSISKVVRDIVGDSLKEKVEDTAGVTLPLTMFVPCGEPQSMTALTQPFEDAQIKIRGPLTALATPNAFVAIAQGNSMECEKVGSIANGDRLLMIPTSDFKKELAPGALVLVRITYEDGSEPRITLKKYADIGVLKANNPKHQAPVPDENTESFEALAICAGVLEKQFV